MESVREPFIWEGAGRRSQSDAVSQSCQKLPAFRSGPEDVDASSHRTHSDSVSTRFQPVQGDAKTPRMKSTRRGQSPFVLFPPCFEPFPDSHSTLTCYRCPATRHRTPFQPAQLTRSRPKLWTPQLTGGISSTSSIGSSSSPSPSGCAKPSTTSRTCCAQTGNNSTSDFAKTYVEPSPQLSRESTMPGASWRNSYVVSRSYESDLIWSIDFPPRAAPAEDPSRHDRETLGPAKVDGQSPSPGVARRSPRDGHSGAQQPKIPEIQTKHRERCEGLPGVVSTRRGGTALDCEKGGGIS